MSSRQRNERCRLICAKRTDVFLEQIKGILRTDTEQIQSSYRADSEENTI